MLVVTISLIFLVACSSRATPTAVAHLNTPNSSQEIPSIPKPETATAVSDRATSAPPAVASAVQPALAATVSAAASVVSSPPPSHTLGGVAVSPLPSPSPGANEPSPPVAEAMSSEPAPDFTLEADQGKPVTLSDYQGASNIVLVFYRGQT
jgi:hypothetical protein